MTGSGADVGDEASSAGVGLGGALLAGVPPGPADGGAAEGFGADDPAQLALAHLVVDLGEARPRPVVWVRGKKKLNQGPGKGELDGRPRVSALALKLILSRKLQPER